MSAFIWDTVCVRSVNFERTFWQPQNLPLGQYYAFVFWKNPRIPKRHFEINWPLDIHRHPKQKEIFRFYEAPSKYDCKAKLENACSFMLKYSKITVWASFSGVNVTSKLNCYHIIFLFRNQNIRKGKIRNLASLSDSLALDNLAFQAWASFFCWWWKEDWWFKLLTLTRKPQGNILVHHKKKESCTKWRQN